MSSLTSYQEIDIKIDLKSYWLTLKRRFSLAAIIFISINTFLFVYLTLKKPLFKSGGIVLIKPQSTSSIKGLETLETGKIEVFGNQSDPLFTEIEVIRSYPILRETASIIYPSETDLGISNIQKGIEIESIPGTDMLKVSFVSSDPYIAAEVTNTLIEVYIDKNVENNRTAAKEARKFIEAQLPKTAEAVKKAESELRAFKEQNKILDMDRELSEAVRTNAELEIKLAELQSQLAALNVQQEDQMIDSGIGFGTVSGSTNIRNLNISNSYQNMTAELGEIQNRLNKERNRFHPQHPLIAHLEKEEAELKKQIKKSQKTHTKVLRQSLERQIQKLSEHQALQKAKAENLPQMEQANRELERNLSAAQITYESLLTDLHKVRLAENQTIGNVQIISPPNIPEEPITNVRNLVLGGGPIFALLISLIAAFTVDYLDQNVKDIKQAKNILAYPLVGVIPNFFTTMSTNKISLDRFRKKPKLRAQSEVGKVYIKNNPLHLNMIIAYNGLQANLSSMSIDKTAKVIAVTSSVSNEGKSEVAANLSAAFARSGKRVLLIDSNQYSPSQHYIWGIDNLLGFNEILLNHSDLPSALQEVMPNLFLLPNGNLSADTLTEIGISKINDVYPLNSLSSRLFLNEFIDKVSTDYDAIILDTPSIIDSMDASFLCQIADQTLFVVRPGVVDVSSIMIAKQILSSSSWDNLGIIANSIDKNDPNRFSSLQSTEAKVKAIPRMNNNHIYHDY